MTPDPASLAAVACANLCPCTAWNQVMAVSENVFFV